MSNHMTSHDITEAITETVKSIVLLHNNGMGVREHGGGVIELMTDYLHKLVLLQIVLSQGLEIKYKDDSNE
jgi:hypothetical protein